MDVQFRQPLRCVLDPWHLLGEAFAQFAEQLRLDLGDAGLGIEHLRFPLLELRSDEPLRVREGLFALVSFGNAGEVRSGDFDVVTEHLVEPDLQAVDTGALPLFGLQSGDPVDGPVAHFPQFVQPAIVPGPDHPSGRQGNGRVGIDRGIDLLPNVGQGIEAGSDGSQSRRDRRRDRLPDRRKRLEGATEAQQLPRGDASQRYPGRQSLEIPHFAERRTQFAPAVAFIQELRYRVESRVDLLPIQERP